MADPGSRREAAGALVLGDDDGLAHAVVHRFKRDSMPTQSALGLSDSEISSLLAAKDWQAVVVVTRDDVLALRLTLLTAHLRPDLPLWVTMFDRTVARRVRELAPLVRVLSPSEIVAEDLARRCAEAIERPRGRRWRGLRVVDGSLRLLVGAGLGLLFAFLFEAAITMIALHHSPIDAVYLSTRSVATVAASEDASAGPAWFKLLSAANMIVALLLVAVFTAALVRRLSQRSLTTLLGRRAAPARDHVLLIGFGQVGFRLAQALLERGIPVLGVECNPAAPCVRLARSAGIPIAVGRGDDRQTLERLGIQGCAAVAAVTSSDLVNVAAGLAATDLRPEIPIVLRLGDGDVAAETDSLLHLGQISDAHGLAAAALADAITSEPQLQG